LNITGTITYDTGTDVTTATVVGMSTRSSVVVTISENPNKATDSGTFDFEFNTTYNGTTETETSTNEAFFDAEQV